MNKFLIALMILGAGCGRVNSIPSASTANSSDGVQDQPPTSLPTTIVGASSWAGLTGLTESQLLVQLQGHWLSVCLTGYARSLTFTNNQVKDLFYTYSDASCTQGARLASSNEYTISMTGADAVLQDGYDILEDGGPTPYMDIKVNGAHMALGSTLNGMDGTSPSKRPTSWYSFTYLKQ